MKLFTKIFLCSILVFSVAFQFAGCLLIGYSYENAIQQEKKYALSQYQYGKYVLQSTIYMNGELRLEQLSSLAQKLDTPAAFYDKDGEMIYSDLTGEVNPDMGENAIACKVEQNGAKSKMYICGQVVQSEISLFLAIETDIGNTVMNQHRIMDYFQKLYLVILAFGFLLVFFLSMILTKPINQISKTAKSIAGGNYGERIPIRRRDELGELAENFNYMADTVEEKIEELSEAARQKDAFVANFAHEMKTPLTSVIGYADMLYQKDLPRETVKEASGYIFREGMRLEMLSLKMMDLIVLKKQEFELEYIDSEELFRDVERRYANVCRNRQVTFCCEVEKCPVLVEYDFIQTMIFNLIDNAIKADSTEICITGKCVNKGEDDSLSERYQVTVRDNGRGIPEEELGRIKEAFYMVDKSRSRKQHGAGLGLALSEQIANIHGTTLQFENNRDAGILVTFYLSCDREKGEDHA